MILVEQWSLSNKGPLTHLLHPESLERIVTSSVEMYPVVSGRRVSVHVITCQVGFFCTMVLSTSSCIPQLSPAEKCNTQSERLSTVGLRAIFKINIVIGFACETPDYYIFRKSLLLWIGHSPAMNSVLRYRKRVCTAFCSMSTRSSENSFPRKIWDGECRIMNIS